MVEKKSTKSAGKSAGEKMDKTSKAKTAKTKPEEKKSRKKLWTILGCVFGGLVVVGLAAWGIITAVIENQPLEQDWAQTYYVYLDENKLDPELKNSEGEVKATAEEYGVEFYDVEGIDDPVMAVNYMTGEDNYLTFYWIQNGSVSNSVYYTPAQIVMLYNIKNEKSEYYVHYETDGTDYYESLSDEIKGALAAEDADHVKADPTYTFTDKDKRSVTDSKGETYSLTKFEETFVEVDDDTETTVLPVDYDKKDLKQTLSDEAYTYAALEEVAKKHAEMVRQVVEDIEKRQNKIEQVEKENAEIAAKKKAEEEARRAEEEAKKGIKLEGYTIAYGTYLLDEDFIGPTNGEYTIVLKPDGVCTFGGKPCTWRLGERDYAQDVSTAGKHIHKSIFITPSGGGNNYGTSLFAYGNNELGDGDIEHYTYAGH